MLAEKKNHCLYSSNLLINNLKVNQTMLYIIVEEHSGILLNIYRCLSAANYKITSNKFGKRASDDKSFVMLDIAEGSLPLQPSLESQLLNIEGCQDILYEEPIASNGNSTGESNNADAALVKKEVQIVAKDIIENFGNIENIVRNFSQRHIENNSTYLYALGHSVGEIVYRNEYALGKPLKLELALKRMLADAIKSFGKTSCSKSLVSIEGNIFCNTANPNGHCDFTKGFMTGFLHGSPTTKEVRVENISCRSHGQSSCSFEFH